MWRSATSIEVDEKIMLEYNIDSYKKEKTEFVFW